MVRMNQHFLAPPFMKPMLLMVSQPLRMICKTGDGAQTRAVALDAGFRQRFKKSPESYSESILSGKNAQRDIPAEEQGEEPMRIKHLVQSEARDRKAVSEK